MPQSSRDEVARKGISVSRVQMTRVSKGGGQRSIPPPLELAGKLLQPFETGRPWTARLNHHSLVKE